jgi:lipid II:glycine glycyltransferase (peptidoglycan interpeptide bridge formation enzyme)
LINLNQDEQTIIRNITSNKRGNIHKSINKETEFRELNTIDEIIKGIALIHTTYKRAKLPVPNSAFFINAYNQLYGGKILRVFGAYADTNLIGVRFELCFNNTIYDWYAGSDLNYKNRYPNDFLPYQILLWGHKNGFKSFDFGGAGKPGVSYGVREHKIKFGGELVEYGRFERINKPILMELGQIGLNLYKKFK